MAAGVTIQLKRKAGAFSGSDFAAGEMGVDVTNDVLYYSTDGTDAIRLSPVRSKSVSIESPTDSEDITLFHTAVAITITRCVAVLRGSDTPSVTYNIQHSASDRSASGTSLWTSDEVITSTTTADAGAAFADATVSAGSFVWLETSAQSGTVDELHVTIEYTED